MRKRLGSVRIGRLRAAAADTSLLTPHSCRLAVLLLVAAGCQQQMASQPPYRPLKPSSFFADGRSARPLPEGTVARDPVGQRAEAVFYTGTLPAGKNSPEVAVGLVGAPGLPAAGALLTSAARGAFIDFLPYPADQWKGMVQRGQERFNIYCAVCHGRDGDGQGMIPQRGFTHPPSFHTDLSRGFLHKGIQLPLRQAPVGYYFEVITHGYGAMPDYREQVAVPDRWAIISYVRALQLSRHLPLAALGKDAKERLLQELDKNR